jgi:hypothetical protein
LCASSTYPAARAAGVRRIVLLHSKVTGPAGMPEIRQAVEESGPGIRDPAALVVHEELHPHPPHRRGAA